LNFDTIKDILETLDISRPFISSSPSNGYETAQNPVADDPQDWYNGDVHYYNYGADCWDVTTFPRPRFASEYGFQSFPSYLSLKPVSSADDWTFMSPFMLHRQHHGNGNNEILEQVKLHFILPTSRNPLKQYLYTIYMNQIEQGLCIKSESEHYRRIKTELDTNGAGYTMGAIYWQLNDIWQGASWASIEYGGRWKVLHYYAKTFFAPVLVSSFALGGSMTTYLVNDLTTDISGATLSVNIWSWASGLQKTYTSTVGMKALTAGSVWSKAVNDIIADSNCGSVTNCVATISLTDATNAIQSENVFYLSSLKDVTTLKDPQLTVVSVTQSGNRQFTISLKASAIAAFVWLETSYSGRFSDNGFLFTSPTKDVFFYANEDVTATDVQKSLLINNLFQVYAY